MDNLLREYAGTHYEYDERGNQIRRWHNGQQSRLHWDLFDRLVRFEDNRLRVDYAYDPLGRRLYKHSNAHHQHRNEAGSQWNQNEQARKQRELGCGFTLFGWDGDTLAWESSPAQADGANGKTVHYLYEPGTFVPVAQALRHQPMRLLAQPSYTGAYDIDKDPLWTHTPQALPIDVLAWYQCDHLGTPQELTDHTGQIAWSAQYKAWGEVKEQCSDWAQRQGLKNSIRFQGQYHDHETGQNYNRHRYYDPPGGRFVSKDPISYAGGLNLYAYAPNPVEWIDALGLQNEALPLGSEKNPFVTSRAARREAMRQARIPTSQQPISQSKNNSGWEYRYETPQPGGGKGLASVQQQTMDVSHPDQPHWEAGKVKLDDDGNPRMSRHGRPQIRNGKGKAFYIKECCK